MIKKPYLFSLLLIPFVSCQLSGVENEEEELNDTSIVQNTIDSSEIEVPMMLEDSINGAPNEMVFQRNDGLRIEWTTKKDDQIQLNDVVMVNYTARVAAGEVYDSNKPLGEPVPLKTNIGMMIKGWEEGLLMMHIGDKGRIMIPSDLAYGEDGYLTIVPPRADIIVDIEIVSRVEPVKLESGVLVYKWKSSTEGKTPVKNQLITFDYFAYKKGNKPGMYDNSYQNEAPFSFKYEYTNVVEGLHIGMSVMKAGENAFIEIPSKMAYGSKGLVDLVPANTDIVYDVRVASIE
ncbi:MAG: FKBP-type peptidyl-prolyl cis-trans isomerase [Crocinitomicaceae bacterium]|nr:FKBP-type peptidyl-prolyl cis-trans isomerase [Crocinitomicaceae bacterium]